MSTEEHHHGNPGNQAIYVMTDGLALVPRGQPPRTQPGTVGQ